MGQWIDLSHGPDCRGREDPVGRAFRSIFEMEAGQLERAEAALQGQKTAETAEKASASVFGRWICEWFWVGWIRSGSLALGC